MFRCKIHGIQKLDWCDDCKKLLKCDCSVSDWDRRCIVYGEMERTVTIYIEYCKNCGDLKRVITEADLKKENRKK